MIILTNNHFTTSVGTSLRRFCEGGFFFRQKKEECLCRAIAPVPLRLQECRRSGVPTRPLSWARKSASGIAASCFSKHHRNPATAFSGFPCNWCISFIVIYAIKQLFRYDQRLAVLHGKHTPFERLYFTTCTLRVVAESKHIKNYKWASLLNCTNRKSDLSLYVSI